MVICARQTYRKQFFLFLFSNPPDQTIKITHIYICYPDHRYNHWHIHHNKHNIYSTNVTSSHPQVHKVRLKFTKCIVVSTSSQHKFTTSTTTASQDVGAPPGGY
jgi:hypothetical protein